MKYLPDEINNKIISIVDQKFETVLVDRINKFIEFFNTLVELREAFPDYDENLMIINTENARKQCESINIQIDKHYQRNENVTFENMFPGLVDHLDNLISQIDPMITVEQSESRFKLLPEDKKIVKLGKRIKIPIFKLQQLGIKLINPFLKVVKRKPIELKYWDQKIPLRNVTFYYFRNYLIKELSSVYEDVFKVLSENSLAFWKYDENYDEEYIGNFINVNSTNPVSKSFRDPEKIISELEVLKNEVKTKALLIIEQCQDEFNNNCPKVDTIELSKSRFIDQRIFKRFNAVKNEFSDTIKEWDNTLYALGEDWELNYDLESTRYAAIEVFLEFGKSLSVKNKIQIYPQFKEISGTLNFINEKLNQSISDIQGLERSISYSKETLHKILLSSVLPNLINSISDLRLPEMINDAMLEIKNHLKSITEKRAFVKTTTFDKKIKSSDIVEIYPREYVSFNSLPKLLTSLEKIKENSIVELKNIQSDIINLGNMADFSLESAITAATTENLSLSETKEIALEGIKISLDKQEQLLDSFHAVCNNVLESLRNSVAEYSEEMYGLAQSSKITEIRIQLAKAKARAKVKIVREKLFTSIKNFIPIIFDRSKEYYKKGFRFYDDTRKQLGLTESSEVITSEISDFLSRANSSVEKLPYIYRRLFQISPLENDRLYISRELEETQLQMAYDSWMNDGYAPVVISAEKGGGITSFLNIFIKKLENKVKIKRVSIKPSICDQKDLLKLLGEIFLPEQSSGIEDVINYLNSEENKQVIVIENLQHMYLRSLKGFLCMKTLTEIIAKTNKNIFWITSTTLYANEFLNKTIRLNDVFGYHIFLKQLSSDQIIELIKKRNAISGYNLEYVPDDNVIRKKDFDKLSYEQKQILLEKEFFSSLTKFSQSNVSLALLFWLRSIREIQDRKVFINADFEISNTILNSLSSEKIFVLQSLVLHDGLRVSDLAKTVHYSLDETNQLTQILYDDGVLVKNGDVLLINPLLYRQTVLILQSRNLI